MIQTALDQNSRCEKRSFAAVLKPVLMKRHRWNWSS